MIRAWEDVGSLDHAWRPPDAAPLGTELRVHHRGRWLRFYTLADGQRIAVSADQRAEQMHRYVSVLGALQGLAIVLTCGYAGRQEVDLPATPWREVSGDPPVQVYASAVDAVADLVPLLQQVARDEAHDVIIGPADLRWMVHPYDGGIDVVGDYPVALAERFGNWLSPRPDGL